MRRGEPRGDVSARDPEIELSFSRLRYWFEFANGHQFRPHFALLDSNGRIQCPIQLIVGDLVEQRDATVAFVVVERFSTMWLCSFC